MSAEGPPLDPRVDRFVPLSAWLRRALAATAVLAVATVLAGPELGTWPGVAMVCILVGAPLLRVGWFVTRWIRRGDPRFAAVGTGVLVVVAVGFGLALLGV